VTPPPALPGVFAALAPVLDQYGYLAVGLLLFLEDFGVPAPGETVLIAASVYAGAGRLNLAVVIIVGVLAAIAGDNVGYAIGRYGGRRLVGRYGRYVGLTTTRVRAAEGFFARHGGKVIVVARFVEGLRQANGIIAGLSGMPWLRFLGFNALGALLWVGLWTTLGDLAGTHIDTIYSALRRYELYLLVVLAVLVLALVGRRVHRKRSRPRLSPAADDEPRPSTTEEDDSGPDRP
jgi:membrane protein DedA with SNARE-associated domain